MLLLEFGTMDPLGICNSPRSVEQRSGTYRVRATWMLGAVGPHSRRVKGGTLRAVPPLRNVVSGAMKACWVS